MAGEPAEIAEVLSRRDAGEGVGKMDPARVRALERGPSGVLKLHMEGQDTPIEPVSVRLCFPWSVPGGYVSLQDGEGRELLLIRSLDEVAPAVREAIAAELKVALFHPVVRRVLSRRNEFGMLSLEVETDRGRTAFQVRSREDVRFLTDRRMLLRDPDGMVYEVPDLLALDTASRRAIEEFL